MRVPASQKMRFGRGNLAEARQALSFGNIKQAVLAINEHARNRQKTVSSKGLTK